MKAWEFHPALVHFPIALLLAGVAVDLYAWRGSREGLWRAATGLLIAGVITAALAVAAGWVAFFTVPATHTEQAHHQMPWHIGTAATMFILFAGVAIVRWRNWGSAPSPLVRAVGLVAAVVLLVAAYLGGTMVYHGGMGIDPRIMAPALHKDANG
jgi:uncharacterized membrane protein